MNHKYRGGLLSGFRFAGEGLRYSFRTQRHFRFHIAAAICVIALGVWLGLSITVWVVLALTIGGVLVTELLNTAVETLVDLVSPEDHLLAKHAKDLAAAAVLVAAIAAAIVGFLVLGPPLWARLGLG